MNCYDCVIKNTTQPAIAICHDCGAGICTDHANTETKYLTTMVPLGMPVAVEPPGRIIRCNTCANANNAVTSAASYRAASRAQHRTPPDNCDPTAPCKTPSLQANSNGRPLRLPIFPAAANR